MTVELYMKLKGVQGECLDSVFRTKGAIQLMTCQFNGSAAPERAKNSSIEGTKSQSVWVSEGFEDEDPNDPDDLRSAFRNLFEESAEEKPQEEEPAPVIEETPQWPFTITFTKTLDSASPTLFQKYCLYNFLSRDQAHAQDIQIEAGKLWLRKYANGKPTPFVIWHFKQVQIVDFSWTSRTDEGDVEESVTFRFRYCRMEYIPQDATGAFLTAVVSEWDLQSNKAEAPAISDATVGV